MQLIKNMLPLKKSYGEFADMKRFSPDIVF